MDCIKVGKLILALRKERGMTQKQLADAMNISDKAVSKWERGFGCPDVSLLSELSLILNVNIEKILLGNLEPNDTDGGNMKRVQFYVCPSCNNCLTASGGAEISCCGRKLTALTPQPADEAHRLTVQALDDEDYLTFSHEMSKAHYISFVAYADCNKVFFIKLYPEQGGELRIPRMRGGRLYFYCNQHGLWVNG